ncbi:hypothetical protein UCRPC4_g03492 [Phaeomoniella chlamydospora]|uniref:Uncharacterized protein n=1 Tax=Phaeomoniella chlamydospora TaxID=158046 RepID=A0A0G2GYK9_PHACM|nr:hypothetical protein UCRPC4_g03492 [Phaeomoniella chlamydospora]
MLVLYFVLSYRHQNHYVDYDRRGSYVTDTEIAEEGRHRHGGLGRLAAAGAAGAGLAALWRRRSRSRPRDDNATDLGPESEESYVVDEKYSDTSRHGLGRRILEVGAIGAGLAAVRSLFKRRERDDSSSLDYRSRPGADQSVTDGSYSVVDEARPVTPGTPGRQQRPHPLSNPPITPSHRHSESSSLYDDSYLSASPSRRSRHGFRDTLATLGAAAALRQLFKNRRQNKEGRRAEEMRQHEIEQERIQRANSQGQFTGDGFVPRRHRRHGSQTASSYSSLSERPGGYSGVQPAGAAVHGTDSIRPVPTDPVVAGPSNIPITIVPVPATHAPPPPAHLGSSASDIYSTASQPHHHRHRDEAAAGLAGAALGAAAADGSRRRRSGRYGGDGQSPSASVKVKMHNDGQHVTLRRLTEEERQRERRARRDRRRRNGSLSSTSGTEGAAMVPGWRRTEEMERRQAEEMRAEQAAASAAGRPDTIAGPSTTIPAGYNLPPPPPGPPPAASHMTSPPHGINIPPPPPIPESHTNYPPGASSVTSPGTETSGTYSSEFAANRRRRRAERAQAKLARQGRTGVEFT